MGRAVSAIKSNAHVALPHDGPLHHYVVVLSASEADNSNRIEIDADDELLARAIKKMRALQKLSASAAKMSGASPSFLLYKLMTASSIKEQLQALQIFKSNLCQRQSTREKDDEIEMIELMRILLEWTLSFQTPHPLRRALQSIIDVMASQHADESLWTLVIDDVLQSIFENKTCLWKDPLLTLQYACSYAPVRKRIASEPACQLLWRFAQNIPLDPTQKWSKALSTQLDRAVLVANLCKSLVSVYNETNEIPTETIVSLQDFLFRVCIFPGLPVEHLNVAGVAYGKSMFWDANRLGAFIQIDLTTVTHMQRAFLLQGIVATIQDEMFMERVDDDGPVFVQVFLEIFKQLALYAPDPNVRLAALKGIRTLLSRCCEDSSIWSEKKEKGELYTFITEETMQVILHAWENPSSPRLANALPSIFQALVRIMRQQPNTEQLKHLIRTILQQPPNRKSRYIGLETLLPDTGAHMLLEVAGLKGEENVLHQFLLGICDYGHNTVAISDLWAKLLRVLLQEKMQMAGVVVACAPQNRKERRKIEREAPLQNDNSTKEQADIESKVLDEWMGLWIPSLAHALVVMEASRRKQVAAFCLVRIKVTVADSKNKAAKVFRTLIKQINTLRLDSNVIKLPLAEQETLEDRILWAECECAIAAKGSDLIRYNGKRDHNRNAVEETVGEYLTSERLCAALAHRSIMVRLSAFQAMEVAVACLKSEYDRMACLLQEAVLWKQYLHGSIKGINSQYLSTTMHSLLVFMDRLSMTEAEFVQQGAELFHLREFVIDFLIDDLLLKRCGYPGSPADKETFSLALFECILVFVAREHTLASTSKVLPKSGALFTRTRAPEEEEALALIQKQLSSKDVFLTMTSLLSSTWDNTRSKASSCVQALVQLSLQYKSAESNKLTHISVIEMESRAIYLASSPRQRESDTGAQMLFMLLSLTADGEKEAFFERLAATMETRLILMTNTLHAMLNSPEKSQSCQLPLLHGLIGGLRLIIEETSLTFHSNPKAASQKISDLLCQSLRLSLSVVADVEEGSALEGLNECIPKRAYDNVDAKTSIVNPGALGANGIAGSLRRLTIDDETKRKASQRLVIGSWLLTKESCETLASVLCIDGVQQGSSLVNEAGTLLLSTLVSLKHTGAAYAAHKAVQRLSRICYDSDDELTEVLPQTWTNRLLNEILAEDKIRNSSLRRSTGYALGFLALMRSEVSSRRSTSVLCEHVLKSLLTMSLPSSQELQCLRSSLQLTNQTFFSYIDGTVASTGVSIQMRVHALNVLRLILMDAPLSEVSMPMAGDAIISSIMGYLDSEWTIRNSSTMVFSAAMLRVVDSDKNGMKNDPTGSRAISISELFLSYPALPNFLRAVLTVSVQIQSDTGSLPPELPIMMLLSRVQSLLTSGADAVFQIEALVPPLIEAIKHNQMTVRRGAAQALANLSCERKDSPSSMSTLVRTCLSSLSSPETSANQVHGALLLLRQLVETSNEARKVCLKEHVADQLLGDILSPYSRPRTPPLSLTVALGILSRLDQSVSVERVLSDLQDWIEHKDKATNVVGLAELGASVGRLWCERLNSFWDGPSRDYCEKITKLILLLSSPSFDIRVSSIKCFKKSVYEGVDGLLARASEDEAMAVINMLFAMLVTCLVRELETDSHPPNLRRLSRCIIECLGARDKLGARGMLQTVDLGLIWKCSLGLNLHQKKRKENSKYMTALDGNAAELMAFVVRDQERCVDDISLFASILLQLSDEYAPWKLRHSAALAIKTSGILRSNVKDRLLLRELSFAAIRLMQDADADVRQAMASDGGNTGQTLVQMNELQPVSEVIMQRVICSDTSYMAPFVTIETVCLFAMKYTDTLETTIKLYMKEFCNLESSSSSSELLNVKSDRKIFEEENVNEYAEMGIPMQLMVHKLLTNLSTEPLNEQDQVSIQTLQARCESILKVLSKERLGMYDVTYEHKVMPSLHSLLLVTGCCLCFLDHGREKLQSLASQVLRFPAHPLIRAILCGIQASDKELFRHTMTECCFLIH